MDGGDAEGARHAVTLLNRDIFPFGKTMSIALEDNLVILASAEGEHPAVPSMAKPAPLLLLAPKPPEDRFLPLLQPLVIDTLA